MSDSNDHDHLLIWLLIIALFIIGMGNSSNDESFERRLRTIEDRMEIDVPVELKVELDDDTEDEDS